MVYLKGIIKNSNNSLPLVDVSAISRLDAVGFSHQIIPDTNGYFSISFPLNSIGYFRLGRNVLYLSPGDKINIFLDYNEPLNAKFKGSHAAENMYLRGTPVPPSGSFLNGGSAVRRTVSLTIDTIIKQGEVRKKLLLSAKVSENFKRLELARVKADIINSLLKIQLYYSYVYKIKADSLTSFSAECNKLIAPYLINYEAGLLNPEYLDLEVYQDAAFDIINKTDSTSKNALKIIDWANAVNLSGDIKRANDKTKIKDLQPEIYKIANLQYRSVLLKLTNDKLRFSKGDPAVNIHAEDLAGKKVSIKDYKGKIIIVDMWATWCAPCQPEIPHFEDLATNYKENPNIVFISLSIDNNKGLWKRKLVHKSTNALQWNSLGDLMSAYSDIGIPRTIIIDKDFNIVELNGLQPSSPEMKKYIETLLTY